MLTTSKSLWAHLHCTAWYKVDIPKLMSKEQWTEQSLHFPQPICCLPGSKCWSLGLELESLAIFCSVLWMTVQFAWRQDILEDDLQCPEFPCGACSRGSLPSLRLTGYHHSQLLQHSSTGAFVNGAMLLDNWYLGWNKH